MFLIPLASIAAIFVVMLIWFGTWQGDRSPRAWEWMVGGLGCVGLLIYWLWLR